MADMRKYASGLLRPEDLNGGSRQEKIINVQINDKLNAPVLTFESGEEMVAWNSICRVLVREYGSQDSDWIGHTIELYLTQYTNRDGDVKDTISVRPITTRDQQETVAPPPKDMDDSIPF